VGWNLDYKILESNPKQNFVIFDLPLKDPIRCALDLFSIFFFFFFFLSDVEYFSSTFPKRARSNMYFKDSQKLSYLLKNSVRIIRHILRSRN
jgi:hypothetical protein